MKKLHLFILLFIPGLKSMSQAPQFINYQAIARYTNSSIPIPHQTIAVNFKIRQGTATGNILFEEDQSTTTDDYGLFNLKIGYVKAASFKQINWSTGSKFLEVKINGNVTGVSELSSTPYSFYADVAGYANIARSSLDWKNVGDTILYSTGKRIGIGTANPEAPLDINGSIRIKGETSSTRIRLDAHHADADNWITSFDENGNRLWILNLADRSVGNRFGLYSQKAGSHVFNITTDGNVGIKTNASSSYALSVKGEVYIDESASVKVLKVRGGNDVYEIWNANETILPGYVVIMDTNRPVNSIKLSTKAYDRCIVGVVSGAGTVRPGIGLTQEGVLDGNTQIACLGRVNVYVTGPVQPGDLLTSSDTPGHAMAIKKKRVENGVVLGKALSKPDSDGLVLMQVMPQ